MRGDRGKVTKLGVKDEGYSVIEKRGSGGKLSEIIKNVSNVYKKNNRDNFILTQWHLATAVVFLSDGFEK